MSTEETVAKKSKMDEEENPEEQITVQFESESGAFLY